MWRLLRSPRAPDGPDAPAIVRAEDEARLVDKFIASYVSWREQSAAVQSAYDRWTSGRGERGAAFAIYCAELALEEHAARAFRQFTERLAPAAPREAPSGC